MAVTAFGKENDNDTSILDLNNRINAHVATLWIQALRKTKQSREKITYIQKSFIHIFRIMLQWIFAQYFLKTCVQSCHTSFNNVFLGVTCLGFMFYIKNMNTNANNVCVPLQGLMHTIDYDSLYIYPAVSNENTVILGNDWPRLLNHCSNNWSKMNGNIPCFH